MRISTALLIIAVVFTTLFTSNNGEAQGRHGRCGHAAARAGHVYTTPRPTHGGYLAPAPKSSYAYGWFGVQPRCHKGVHYGYYNNYKQWSYR